MSRSPRVPPGQAATPGFPVLHFGDVPERRREDLRLRVHGAVATPRELGWDELARLPRVETTADFHCVTGWSRLDNRWGGVRLVDVVGAAGGALADARFVRFGDGGHYETTIPIACLAETILAHTLDGEPLSPEHGGPLRAVVPSLYGWKSCKWLAEIELLARDRLGFWEVRGYHNGADPWREERFV